MANRTEFSKAFRFTAMVTAFCASAMAQDNSEAPKAFILRGQYAGTHDPSIAVDHGTYYVFATGAVRPDKTDAPPPASSTGKAPKGSNRTQTAQLPQLPIRCSKDLHAWHRCGAVCPSCRRSRAK